MASQALATTNELTADLKSIKRLRVTATLQAISTLHKTEQDGRETSTRITLAPSLALNDLYRVTAAAALIQDGGQERKTLMSNTKLSLVRTPLSLTSDTALLVSAGGRLPTNSEDREDNTFQGALVLEPTVLTEWNVFGHGFTTIYGLYSQKNFHKYNRGNLEQANLSYQLDHYFGLETYLVKHLVLTLDGDYIFGQTYQGTKSTKFALGQSLTYEQPKWSATLGHTNGGDVLLYGGTDRNVKIFDKNTSAVFAQLLVRY